MKKVLLLLFLILFGINVSYSADVDVDVSDDLWDNWNSDQQMYGQDKSVSDEDFEKTVKQLEDKKNKRIRKKTVPKGEEFHQSNETEVISEQANKDSLPVVCIPAEIQLEDGILPIGHYQVKGIKEEDGTVSLELYQAHYVMAKFPAVETNDDFGAETISFAKWEPVGDDSIKIIFGSVDFNAYTVVNLKK